MPRQQSGVDCRLEAVGMVGREDSLVLAVVENRSRKQGRVAKRECEDDHAYVVGPYVDKGQHEKEVEEIEDG